MVALFFGKQSVYRGAGKSCNNENLTVFKGDFGVFENYGFRFVPRFGAQKIQT
jgi:hypothetical protein